MSNIHEKLRTIPVDPRDTKANVKIHKLHSAPDAPPRGDYNSFGNQVIRIFTLVVEGRKFDSLGMMFQYDDALIKTKNAKVLNPYKNSPFLWYVDSHPPQYNYDQIRLLEKYSCQLSIWVLESYFSHLIQSKRLDAVLKNVQREDKQLSALKTFGRENNTWLKLFSSIISLLDYEMVVNLLFEFLCKNKEETTPLCVRSVILIICTRLKKIKLRTFAVEKSVKDNDLLQACYSLRGLIRDLKYRIRDKLPTYTFPIKYINMMEFFKLACNLDTIYCYFTPTSIEQTVTVLELQNDVIHVIYTPNLKIFDVLSIISKSVPIDVSLMTWQERLIRFQERYPNAPAVITLTSLNVRDIQFNRFNQTQQNVHVYVKTRGFAEGTHFYNNQPPTNKRNQKTQFNASWCPPKFYFGTQTNKPIKSAATIYDEESD